MNSISKSGQITGVLLNFHDFGNKTRQINIVNSFIVGKNLYYKIFKNFLQSLH